MATLFYDQTGNFVSQQADINKNIGEVNIKTLVKEITQNSLDAVYDSGKPVELYFQVVRVPVEMRYDILDRILLDDTYTMIENLKKMVRYAKNEQDRFKNMIEILQEGEGEDLYLLVVSDFNTYGLDGDDKLSLDVDSRFQGFNYKLGISDKGDALGSFGEGRMAALYSSKIQFVYQISHLAEPWDNQSIREFGLGIHGVFQNNGSIYSGIFFGCEIDRNENPRSIMYNYIDNTFGLIPDTRDEQTGTSFVFPFFDPYEFVSDDQDTYLAIEDFLEQVKLELISSFFPSITDNKLLARIQYKDLGSDRLIEYDEVIDKPAIPPVLRKMVSSSEITGKEQYINFDLDETVLLEVPIGKTSENIEEQLHIRFLQIREENIQHSVRVNISDFVNKVGFFRSGMLIETYQAKDLPIIKPFIGLLNVKREENPKSHEFLRLSEPVKHNHWNPSSQRLKERHGKRRPAIRLNALFRRINDLIMDNFGIESVDAEEIPTEVTEDLFQGYGIEDMEKITTKASRGQVDAADPHEPITVDDPTNTPTTGEKEIPRKKKLKKKNKTRVKDTGKDTKKAVEEIEKEIGEKIKTTQSVLFFNILDDHRNSGEMQVKLDIDDLPSDLKKITFYSRVVGKSGGFNISLPVSPNNGVPLSKADYPVTVNVDLSSLPSSLHKTVHVQFYAIGSS